MSKLPINLPARVSSGQAISADWANSIREAIARLAEYDRDPGFLDAEAKRLFDELMAEAPNTPNVLAKSVMLA